MAKTQVESLTLTVSTVDVFVKIMQFIADNGLWTEAQTYLEENGKSEMFVDYEVLFLFREMLKEHEAFDPEHPAIRRLLIHNKPPRKYCEPTNKPTT